MKQKTPGLTLEPFDQDTFQRVWRRVMPDQDLSPIQPTVPARRRSPHPQSRPVPPRPLHLPACARILRATPPVWNS